jgi:hypothetical protein
VTEVKRFKAISTGVESPRAPEILIPVAISLSERLFMLHQCFGADDRIGTN